MHKLTFWYPVGNAGLEALGNAIALDSLESLQLYVSEVSSDGIAQLAQSPLAKSLGELTLSQEGYLWPESIRGLTSGRWECLHTLSFPNDKIKLAGVGILALSDALPELVSLDLSGNPLGSEGMINLSQSSNLNLRELHLDRASLGREGLWHLTRSDLTNHLRALSLEDNDSPVADVRQLMQSSWFSQLRHLNFHSLTLRDKELTSLAEGDLYQELTKLNWYGSVLDPPCKPSQGAELVKALHLPKIRHLRLAAIPMGTRGAKALAGKEWISSIRMLDLSNCEIGESGAKALLETLCPNQLVHLKLANNDLSSSIEALFDERFPIARLELK